MDGWDLCDKAAVSPVPPDVIIDIPPSQKEEAEKEEVEDAEITQLIASHKDDDKIMSDGATSNYTRCALYAIAGLFSTLTVMFYSAANNTEYNILVANLIFWIFSPVVDYFSISLLHPMIPFSITVWISGHAWLWLTLAHEGMYTFILHYQRIAWMIFFHSLFLEMESISSKIWIQIPIVLSFVSIMVLVTLSCAIHS